MSARILDWSNKESGGQPGGSKAGERGIGEGKQLDSQFFELQGALPAAPSWPQFTGSFLIIRSPSCPLPSLHLSSCPRLGSRLCHPGPFPPVRAEGQREPR